MKKNLLKNEEKTFLIILSEEIILSLKNDKRKLNRVTTNNKDKEEKR